VFIKNKQIKPNALEFRKYQVNIAKSASNASTLVVLPTGLGKTVIALLLIAEHLSQKANKILFLAPTKPLVNQHAQFLKEFLISNEIVDSFTGEVSPEKRKDIWDKCKIIISTPQVIENDLISKRIDLKEVSIIIYDEVHRAVGNYSYVFISELYSKQNTQGLSLGITASPGNDISKILEVCKNLEITNIEIRTKYDLDVKPYVYDLKIEWKEVNLPLEFSQTLQLLRKALSERLKILKEIEVIESSSVSLINRSKLLEIQKKIQGELRSDPNPPKILYKAASVQNAALKIYHAIELMETQGVNALRNYFQRMGSDAVTKGGSKASRDLLKDNNVLEAIAYAKSISIEHPKIPQIVKIVKNQIENKKDSNIIIFTHYRDTSIYVLEQLKNIKDVKPVRFIGQAGKKEDKGLTQKEQIEIIKKFKNREFNVLIATSVAEEGLDIPSTDLVVFFEPVPSEIRSIQRRGRTGRKMPGKVIILITKGTSDVGYYWSSRNKERNMRYELEILRSSLTKKFEDPKSFYEKIENKNNQKSLDDYSKSEKVKIIVDNRENRSNVARFLSSKDIDIDIQQLDVGDYVLSSRIGVERKKVDDFLSTLIDGNLFFQLKKLRDAYSRPVLILEGEGLLRKRNINHNAIFGSLVSTIVDFGIPIISTNSPKETADLLFVMANREQKQGNKAVAIRGEKWAMSTPEQQQFIIEGLPNVSAVLAKRLLQNFGSVKAIVNATEEDLCEIQGIGKNIAADIIKLLNSEYLKE
jgi:Fanconi anemia group M protein